MLITRIVKQLAMNPGTISYKKLLIPTFYHITSTTVPVTIPAKADTQLVLRENNAKSTNGPKAAPRPPQAYATIPNIVSLGRSAKNNAINEMIITQILPTKTTSCSDASFFITF